MEKQKYNLSIDYTIEFYYNIKLFKQMIIDLIFIELTLCKEHLPLILSTLLLVVL